MRSDQYEHPLFRNSPEPNAPLWRYLSFAKLASLLHQACLHFTRVDQFDDHFEGAWPKRDIELLIQGGGGGRILYLTEIMRDRAAASCWVEASYESAAMWRLYAPGGEGVAITTSFRNLCDLVETVDENTFSLAGASRVRYVDHFNMGLIGELGTGDQPPNSLLPFMLKNVSYEHEKEVRALLVAGKGIELSSTGVDLRLENLDNFIHEIITNPFCERWFTEALESLLDRYGLKAKLRSSALSRNAFYKEHLLKPA